MMTPEFRNPFKNAKVLSSDTDPKIYRRTGYDIPRGRADFIMSRSELVRFRSCPQKWLRGAKDEDDSTDSTEFGELFDCIVLQGDRFFQLFTIAPETYKDAKTGEEKPWTYQAKVCKEFRAKEEGAGKTVIKADVNGTAHAAAKRLFEDPISSEFLQCCRRSVMIMAEYHDKATGVIVPIKACLDLVPDKDHKIYGRCLADLKTARSATERMWSNAIVDHSYHVQASMYEALYVAATGEDRNTFLHLVVENKHPWEPCRSFVTTEFMEIGQSVYLGALRDYCRCIQTGHWPSYNHEGNSWPTLPGWKKTEPPKWLMSQFNEEEIGRYQEPTTI
jgi:hypothetical protein